jgi:hypothetical protein
MPTPLDFSDWEDWSDEDWNRFAYPLSFHDEKIDEKMKAAFSKTNDLFESGWQEQDEFIFAACRRNIDWTLLVTWEWPTLLKEVDGLVDDKYAVGRIVDWCNHETVRDGYYVVDDCFDGVTLENADGDEDGDVNNWAFLLMLHPELSDRCDSYGKFDGYSACRLIAAQPQLAEKFSFEILGDFKSDCWHSRDEDDFNDAWERLVKTVPQYEKFHTTGHCDVVLWQVTEKHNQEGEIKMAKKGKTVEVNGITLKYEVGMDGDTAKPYVVITGAKKSLGDLVIPAEVDGVQVTSIGEHAFKGSSGLTSVTIPDGVTSIGDWAFFDCSGLTSVTIPDGVTSIGHNAFWGCRGLTSVTIPNSVTSIGFSAFKETPFDANQQDGLVVLGKVVYAMKGRCPANVTVPGGVTSIGYDAFFRCECLASVTIPDSVTSIGDGAFSNCSGLTSVTIPDSVTSIGDWAFYRCKSIRIVSLPGHLKDVLSEDDVFLDEDCKLKVKIEYRDKDVAMCQSWHDAVFEICSRAYSIGFMAIDSLDEMKGAGYDEFSNAISENYRWYGLDLDHIGASLSVDGAETHEFDVSKCKRVEDGKANSWSEFYNKTGIYANDCDWQSLVVEFRFKGTVDPSKLEFHYKTVAWEGAGLKLLCGISYDGEMLHWKENDPDNKGLWMLLVDKDRYAEYNFGCDLAKLKWQPIPSEDVSRKRSKGKKSATKGGKAKAKG